MESPGMLSQRSSSKSWGRVDGGSFMSIGGFIFLEFQGWTYEILETTTSHSAVRQGAWDKAV